MFEKVIKSLSSINTQILPKIFMTLAILIAVIILKK